MKTTIRKKIWTSFAAFAVILSVVMVGCKKDDDDPDPVPTPEPLKTTYTLKQKDVLGVTGTVTFAEASSGSANTIVTISLTGAPAGMHPAHIHSNTAVEGGGIAYGLTDVDSTGKSSTLLTVSYNTLINFDGYVNVHESAANLATIIAQGDIGGNVLTSTSKTYNLAAVGGTNVTGTALFQKRKNGTTLVTIDVANTIAGMMHPSHIHLGSVATVGGGPIKKTLTDVDGTTGKSVTNVRTLDDTTPITYENWMVYDGYINIHESMINLGIIISQGNIGSN